MAIDILVEAHYYDALARVSSDSTAKNQLIAIRLCLRVFSQTELATNVQRSACPRTKRTHLRRRVRNAWPTAFIFAIDKAKF